MLTSFVRDIYHCGLKIKVERPAIILFYLILKKCCQITCNLTREGVNTDCIPRSVALVDHCGIMKCILCMHAIHMYGALDKCLEIGPTGTNFPYHIIFLLQHYEPKTNYMKF